MVHASVRQNRPDSVERNSQSYPHPYNPGLIEQPSGFYDWAGRRLFLPSGKPDPATPGAYRHQTRPDLCDLEAPDSAPSSPRYEPPHLRHQPGDTFEIGGKPHDPEDPGPYGTPGWFQDRRTGRHRRGELPDPIPPRETGEHEQIEATPPHRPESERPSPTPRRDRSDDDRQPHRFSKLREDAWDRWIIDSEPLARAHEAHPVNNFLLAVVKRALRWIAAIVAGPEQATEHAREQDHGKETRQASAAAEPTVSLRRIPANTSSVTAHQDSSRLLRWGRHFDRAHPVAGGGTP